MALSQKQAGVSEGTFETPCVGTGDEGDAARSGSPHTSCSL